MMRIAQFVFYSQLDGWSCGAQVLRMGVGTLTGNRLSKQAAVAATGATEETGVFMTRLQRAFREFGVHAGSCFKPTVRRVREMLDKGKLVVIDNNSYDESHVLLIVEFVPFSSKRVFVGDSLLYFPAVRSLKSVVRGDKAEVAFAISA